MPRKRKTDQDIEMRMVDEINALLISASELTEYIALSQEGRDDPSSDAFMRQVAAAAEMSGKNYAKAGAPYFRARALAMALTRDEGAPGWTIRGESDSVFASESVFAAAAVEPLVIADGEFAFDRKSFWNRVLALAQTDVPHQ